MIVLPDIAMTTTMKEMIIELLVPVSISRFVLVERRIYSVVDRRILT